MDNKNAFIVSMYIGILINEKLLSYFIFSLNYHDGFLSRSSQYWVLDFMVGFRFLNIF